jgi:ubiquinol-cytochrome c reductase cytochrome b subunit
MRAKVQEWLLDRASLGPETYRTLNRGLPRGIGWWNTLGTVILVLIALEGITGMFLALYYSPHPDAAYETMRFIDVKLPGGRLVHGLHHYGASAVIIALGLHLLRCYVQAAYKAPRELVWLTGLALLLLMVGFGFTGALLPWDQNAWAGTQVRTSYAGEVPIVGPLSRELLRGGPDVGALTITRFYALHLAFLPALLLPLLGVHMLLVWRKGPTPPGAKVGEAVPHTTRFVEHQFWRHAVAAFVAVLAVFLLAVLKPVMLEFKANPSDASYNPRAEWYFLFLFQLVKDWAGFPLVGRFQWIPVAVLPGLALGFLALAPWIDRGPERRASKRPLMIGILAFGLLGMAGMTLRAYAGLHPNATPRHSLYGRFTEGGERPLDPQLVAEGREAFRACGSCHTAYGDYQARLAPDLSGYGTRNFLTQVEGHRNLESLSHYDRFVKFVRGEIRPPKEKDRMPLYPESQLSTRQLDAIAAYISQDPAEVKTLEHQNPRRP